MRNTFKKTILSLALATTLLGSATWSTDSHACSSDPIIASVCLMANGGRIMVGFVPAMGQPLQVGQYQALYSIMGTTFGGTGTGSNGNFNVPDLRGRVVVGSGIPAGTNTQYIPGQKGGALTSNISNGQAGFTLTASNLPAHQHTLNALPTKGVTVTTAAGNLAATTTLTGLTTTTNLAGVTFTSSSSNLTLKAANAAAATTNPTAGSALSTVGFSNAKLYGASTPDTALASTSITGAVSGTLSGNAPGTVSGGTATTTLSGAPSVTIGGNTDPAGSATPTPVTASVAGSVSTMMPFLVMSYSIATQGLYPEFQ